MTRQPELLTRQDLETFGAARIKRGIPLERLSDYSDEYAAFLRVALFFATQGTSSDPMTHEGCLAALAAFLRDEGAWVKTTPRDVLAAAAATGLLALHDSIIELRYVVPASLTHARVKLFLKTLEEERLFKTKAIRRALDEKNRRIHSATNFAVDTEFDQAMMREALSEAKKAFDAGEVPVGAVLVCGKTVIARDRNRVTANRDATEHAEMRVLKAALKHFGTERLPSGTTLYVTLEPCPMCAGALLLSRVGRVVWAASDNNAGALGSALMLQDRVAMNWKVRVTAGLLKQEAECLLKTFFARCRTQNSSGETV